MKTSRFLQNESRRRPRNTHPPHSQMSTPGTLSCLATYHRQPLGSARIIMTTTNKASNVHTGTVPSFRNQPGHQLSLAIFLIESGWGFALSRSLAMAASYHDWPSTGRTRQTGDRTKTKLHNTVVRVWPFPAGMSGGVVADRRCNIGAWRKFASAFAQRWFVDPLLCLAGNLVA